MRYAVFSDLQGSFKPVVRFFRETEGKVDRYLCLGDIVQDGTSFDENRIIDLLRQHEVVAVQGNHDADVVKKRNEAVKKIDPPNLDYLDDLPAVKMVNGFQLVHAPGGIRVFDTDDAKLGFSFLSPEARICFYGHSHRPAVYRMDTSERVHAELKEREVVLDDKSRYLINPGGIGLWWGAQRTFMLYDSERRRIELKQLRGETYGGHS